MSEPTLGRARGSISISIMQRMDLGLIALVFMDFVWRSIAVRIVTKQAETELSEAEPALLAAQSSVRSIKKPQLDEIRTLTR